MTALRTALERIGIEWEGGAHVGYWYALFVTGTIGAIHVIGLLAEALA